MSLSLVDNGRLGYFSDWTVGRIYYFDFAKYFDGVPHVRLFERLYESDCSEDILEWIGAFLSGRRQRVVVNGKKSSWQLR